MKKVRQTDEVSISPLTLPNASQVAVATVMAYRVVKGNASEREMDFVQWYVSLDLPQLDQRAAEDACKALEDSWVSDSIPYAMRGPSGKQH